MFRFAFLLPCAVLFLGCGLKTSTIPVVSVGNTGCTREKLAVFNYQPEQRSWTAVCADKAFACSDVGRRTTRCAPVPGEAVSAELLRRASWLRTLPPERAALFIREDVAAYAADAFDRTLATVALASAAAVGEAKSPHELVVLASEEATRLHACAEKKPYAKYRVESNGGLRWEGEFHSARACFKRAVQGVGVSPEQSGHQVLVLTGLTKTQVDEHRAALAKRMASAESPQAEQVAASTPATLPAPSAVSAAAPAPAVPSPIDAEIRRQLDAKAEDLLACVAAPRALIEASSDAEGHLTVSLRGLATDDPVQGCVRSVMGSVRVAGGPLVVVHLVRSP